MPGKCPGGSTALRSCKTDEKISSNQKGHKPGRLKLRLGKGHVPSYAACFGSR